MSTTTEPTIACLEDRKSLIEAAVKRLIEDCEGQLLVKKGERANITITLGVGLSDERPHHSFKVDLKVQSKSDRMRTLGPVTTVEEWSRLSNLSFRSPAIAEFIQALKPVAGKSRSARAGDFFRYGNEIHSINQKLRDSDIRMRVRGTYGGMFQDRHFTLVRVGH